MRSEDFRLLLYILLLQLEFRKPIKFFQNPSKVPKKKCSQEKKVTSCIYYNTYLLYYGCIGV